MPHVADPARGWVATANNRPAPDDFPYPLAAPGATACVATRIRELIEAKPKLSRSDMMSTSTTRCRSIRNSL